MPVPPGSDVAALVAELGQFHGFRTLWRDREGQVCHAEPDEELEQWGYAYLGTVMRPSAEAVSALLQCAPIARPEPVATVGWAPVLAASGA
jgi:hypothetical protein